MASTAKKLADAPVALTEAEITRYVLDSISFKEQKKALNELEKSLESREKDLIYRLEAGAKVQSKVYRLAVDRSKSRRNVSWKDVAASLWALLGKDPRAEAEKVIEATEPTIYPALVVSELR